MKRLPQLLLPTAALLSMACTANDTPERLPDKVVFVFAPRPDIPNRIDFPGGSYSPTHEPVLSFRSEDPAERIATVDSLRSDTLVVPFFARRMIATLRYNFCSTADVLLHNGDTVLFRMAADTLPQFEIRNRPTAVADLNFDALRARRYGRTYGFTTHDHYNRYGFILAGMEPKGYLRLEEIGRQIDAQYARELKDEGPWIDSLHDAGALSDETRDLYTARNAHYKQMHRLYPRSQTPLHLAQQQTAPDLYAQLAQYNDSLYRNDFYGYYAHLYHALADKCFGSKNIIRASQSIYPDARDSYDQAECDTLQLGVLKERMLCEYFAQIDENFSIDDTKRYYDRLINTLTDTTLLCRVRERFGSELGDELHKSDDISLLSLRSDTTSLRRIIADNAGKVLYVDFYASWCVPCMEGMPASEQLRKDYADQEVVFVYMAFNDKPEKWRNAVGKARLQGVEHNYLILSPRLSTMIGQLEVRSIPRLLLFGRDGKLAHRNAPRPESPEIRPEIDRLLAAER